MKKMQKTVKAVRVIGACAIVYLAIGHITAIYACPKCSAKEAIKLAFLESTVSFTKLIKK